MLPHPAQAQGALAGLVPLAVQPQSPRQVLRVPLGGPNTAQAHPHQPPYSKVVSTAQACAPYQPGCLAPHPSRRSSTLPFLKPVLSSTRPLTDPPIPLCIPIPNTGGPCRACHIVTLESVLMSVPHYCSCQQGCVWSPQDQGLHRRSTLHQWLD